MVYAKNVILRWDINMFCFIMSVALLGSRINVPELPWNQGLYVNFTQCVATEISPTQDIIYAEANINTIWNEPHYWIAYVSPINPGVDPILIPVTSGTFSGQYSPQTIRFKCLTGNSTVPHGSIYVVKILVYNMHTQAQCVRGVWHK